MTYSTLMVHLELEHTNDARLRIAGDLAEKFEAKLIGIAASDPRPPYYRNGAFVHSLIERERNEIAKRMSETEERFRAAVKDRARKIEWRCAMARPTEYVAREARAADLVITGANRDGALLDPQLRLDPSDLVMQAGRPVFVVPPEAEHLKLKHVLIAWKDTREARRAVSDALPLLHKAKYVDVIEVAEGDVSQGAAQHHVNDVVAWLVRHNISAVGRVSQVPDDPDAIENLWKNGVDLVVAGAYGHTRFREWVIGGVTRKLITQSQHCSFLAH